LLRQSLLSALAIKMGIVSNYLQPLIITTLLFTCIIFVTADQFTEPPSDKTDLSTTYQIGQTVQVTWTTSIQNIELDVSQWGENAAPVIGVLLSQSYLPLDSSMERERANGNFVLQTVVPTLVNSTGPLDRVTTSMQRACPIRILSSVSHSQGETSIIRGTAWLTES
jgi:hypothetical protein